MRRVASVTSWLPLALVMAAARVGAVDCYTEVDPVYLDTDVPSLVKATTPAQIERIRTELIEYIWKAPALPEDLPSVATNVTNPFADLPTPPGVARIDELTVPMDDLVARMYLFVPEHASRRLVIFHQGHADVLWYSNGRSVIRRFLAERVPVLVVFMPMYGPNTAPWGPVPFFHWPLMWRETPSLSPIRYFLEPVVRAVTYAQQVLHIRHISMVGVSGGGWTTTLAAAVDPRITVSVSVAGSVPSYLRSPSCPPTAGTGDYEQIHPPLYAIADYLDLYVLAAYGRHRGHLQVINQFDPCCSAGLGYQTYGDFLRNLVERLPRGGQYEMFLDSSHTAHIISPYVLDTAIEPFVRYRRL